MLWNKLKLPMWKFLTTCVGIGRAEDKKQQVQLMATWCDLTEACMSFQTEAASGIKNASLDVMLIVIIQLLLITYILRV